MSKSEETEVEKPESQQEATGSEVGQEDLSIDSFIFGPAQSSDQPENFLSSEAISGQEFDPITEAIRNDILAKQRELIGEHLIAKESAERWQANQEKISQAPEADKAELEKKLKQEDEEEKAKLAENFKNPELFRKYCGDDENQEKINEALKDASLKKALEGVEIAGYRGIHDRFDSTKYPGGFKPMLWQDHASDTPNVRQQIVRGADGEELATLTETTHKINPPVKIRKSDGTEVEVKNYRTIDFPSQLEEGKGPMHVSLAAKDANGNNIAASKAVYFTAHWDRDGKLVEVSSPPLKFRDDSPDSVAFIEHQGQIYTLPVTQKKYQEMMQEVAKNHGHGVDISRSIERSSDSISISAEVGHKQEVEQSRESSIVGEEVSKILRRQSTILSEFSPERYELADNKQEFLKKIIESGNLSLDEQVKSFEAIIKDGGRDAASEVIKVVAGSKYANEITNNLLKGEYKGEVLGALAANQEGKELLDNAYVAANTTERTNILNLIQDSGNLSQDDRTSLTKRLIESVDQPGQSIIVDKLEKSTEGENLLKQVAEESSATLTKENIKETKSPRSTRSFEEGKPVAEVKPLDRTPQEQAKAIKHELLHPMPVNYGQSKDHKEMAQKLFEGLESKSTLEEKRAYMTEGLSGLSDQQKRQVLKELLTVDADKRAEFVKHAEQTGDKKEAAIVGVQTDKRVLNADGTPLQAVGKRVKAANVTGKKGGMEVTNLIREEMLALDKLVAKAKPNKSAASLGK